MKPTKGLRLVLLPWCWFCAEAKGGGTAEKRPDRNIHPIVWILAAGLVVRLLLLLAFRDHPLRIWDERDYQQIAHSLLNDGQYCLDGQPSAMRPPLFPAVMAGIYKLAGSVDPDFVRLFQMLTGLATTGAIYLLGREIYDRRISTWAAGLYCFYPSMLGQANLLLSETLFTFWLVLSCLCVVRAFGDHPKDKTSRSESIGYLVLGGFLLGAAALTRSVMWLFPPILAVYVLVTWRMAWWRRVIAVVGMVVAFALVLAPWSIRSSRLEKTFIAVDTMGGRNVMMGNYEHTPLARSWDAISIDGEKSWYRVLTRENPNFSHLTQGQRDKLALRYAIGYVMRHPGQTLLRCVTKFFNFWQLERSFVAGMAEGHYGNLPLPAFLFLTGLLFGSYILAVVSGIFGAIFVPPKDWRVFGFLLLLVVFINALHTVAFAHSRYHLPLVPIILLFSSAAVVHFRTILENRHTRWFWIATGLCMLLVGGWTWEIATVDFSRFLEAIGLGY